jgi:tetratricopeptide (TPR) repeat protein
MHRVFFFALILSVCFSLEDAGAQSNRTPQALYNAGREAMTAEDWYFAAESFLECLNLNPAHSEAARALAECYYELGEYDQALIRVRKARQLARLNIETQNLEAFILVALGRLDEAGTLIKDVLAREPYNREALFAAAELDIARGRAGDAAARFKNAVRLYGDDRRLLVSLALVLGSLGDYNQAQTYIERAEIEHPDDYRVFYYAAWLESKTGKLTQAIHDVERSLFLRPGFPPARNLLGTLRYQSGDFNTAARLADESIAASRNDTGAWFLKGMALWRLGRPSEARLTLEQALGIAPDDEFIRAAFETILIASTPLEAPERGRWAAYHFSRAAAYKDHHLSNEALFEYRRGLRINPYADERYDYAGILRQTGSPGAYLEEMRFMQDLGKGNRAINDAVETYTALLSTALPRLWDIKTEEIKRHWNIAVFSIGAQSAFYHTDAAAVAAAYIKDIMAHDRNINVMNLQISETSFGTAFRTAREAQGEDGTKCDYFLLVSVAENDRSLSIKGGLYVARTGAKAAEFIRARTGSDRLRNACLNIIEQLDAALPFRAALIRRNADRGVIDKGKLDGIAEGTVFNIIKKGGLELAGEGIGYKYLPADIAGTFAITQIDEEASAGTLTRQGYFDLIATGDEIIPKTPTSVPDTAAAKTPAAPENAVIVDPELRTMLMRLR